MSRRPWGDGSVHPSEDGSGRKWSFEIPRGPDGKRRRAGGRAKTEAEARAKMRRARSKWEQRLREEAKAPAVSVAQAVEHYAEVRRGEPMETGTRAQHARAGVIVTEGLGSVAVSALTVQDCDQFLKAVAAGQFGKPYGRPQLRRLRRFLVNVIGNQVRVGAVARNVAELAVVPEESSEREARRDARALHLPELRSLLAVSSGVVAITIDLSGRNGLRPAEVRGLRWSRVDLDRQTVRVDAQMNRNNEVVKAKTKRAVRTIRIDRTTAERLSAWRRSQIAAAETLGSYWSGNAGDLVITSRVGTAINQRNIHRSLAKASRKAELLPSVSGYDLRHTAITHQVERRIPVDKIADWAGTSERMIWETYRAKLDEISEIGPIDPSDRDDDE